MLQNDPSERDWNSRYCYSHGFVDEATGEEKCVLRSICNSSAIVLTKAQWNKLAALFEKAWPDIVKAQREVIGERFAGNGG